MIRSLFKIFIIFNLLYANAGFAFFQVDDQPEDLRLDNTTIEAPTQDNIYHFYDNYNSSEEDFFLSKKKRNFLSFDQLEINIPLRLLSKNLTSGDDAVDRMLATNLRIKLLMDEYNAIQKRAGRLMNRKTGTFPPAIKSYSNRFSGNAPKNINSENIDHQRKSLTKVMNSIHRLGGTSAHRPKSENPIILDTVVNLEGSSNQGWKNGTGINRPPQNRISSASDKKAYNRYGSGTSVSSQDTKLPWIFEFFLKSFSYVMNNRIEIMLYALFIVLIGFMVSLKVQR